MYRPLDKRLKIADSDIDGQGLFATKDIPAGTNLGITHIEDRRFPDSHIRTPLGGFYNYSETPNCRKIELGGMYELWTIQDIKEGEELTVDYTLYKP